MRRILITGASSGIGKALAIALAEPGTELILTGRRPEALQSVAKEVSTRGAQVQTHILELAEADQVKGFAAAIAGQSPRLDVLIHNAAVIKLGPIVGSDVADLDWHYAANLRAPVLLTQLLSEAVCRASGQVVFINSTAGLHAKKDVGFYAVSKHGLKGLADSLREELAPGGVSVLSVFPARVNTPMQQRVLQMEGAPADVRTFLQPEEIAPIILDAMQRCKQGAFCNISLHAGSEPETW